MADKRGEDFFLVFLSQLTHFSHLFYELLKRRMVLSFLKLKSSRKEEGCSTFPTKNQIDLSTTTNLEEPSLKEYYFQFNLLNCTRMQF